MTIETSKVSNTHIRVWAQTSPECVIDVRVGERFESATKDTDGRRVSREVLGFLWDSEGAPASIVMEGTDGKRRASSLDAWWTNYGRFVRFVTDAARMPSAQDDFAVSTARTLLLQLETVQHLFDEVQQTQAAHTRKLNAIMKDLGIVVEDPPSTPDHVTQ